MPKQELGHFMEPEDPLLDTNVYKYKIQFKRTLS